MNILIIANHYAVCSARYATAAFRRLGHTVTHVGPAMGRNIWGMQVPQEYVWEPDAHLAEYSKLSEWSPTLDLVIVMDSDPAILDWAGNASYFRAPTVVWAVDNHCRQYARPDFQHYFLAHKSVSVMPFPEVVYVPGGDVAVAQAILDSQSDMTWLPCAYDPVAFPPSTIPFAEREYDVCMIGVMYEQRWLLVNAMRAAGLKVLAGTGLVYDAYRDAHHNSRVALASSFNGDLPIRLFEGAGMGCAVLCDSIADLAALEPKGLNIYTSIESAVTIAQMLVRGDGYSGQAQVNYSRAWAASQTWDVRAQKIIDWLEARS